MDILICQFFLHHCRVLPPSSGRSNLGWNFTKFLKTIKPTTVKIPPYMVRTTPTEVSLPIKAKPIRFRIAYKYIRLKLKNRPMKARMTAMNNPMRNNKLMVNQRITTSPDGLMISRNNTRQTKSKGAIALFFVIS